MVVIPVTSFKDPAWALIAQDLWPILANSLGARRLARQVCAIYVMVNIKIICSVFQ